MRPISFFASILVRILDSIPYLLLLAGVFFGGRQVSARLDVDFMFVGIPIAACACLAVFVVARPVRKASYMTVSKTLASVGFGAIREAGVFMLLRVAQRYSPQDPVTDFIGMQALHRIYDSSSARSQAKLREILARVAAATSPVAPAAHDFLDEVAPVNARQI